MATEKKPHSSQPSSLTQQWQMTTKSQLQWDTSLETATGSKSNPRWLQLVQPHSEHTQAAQAQWRPQEVSQPLAGLIMDNHQNQV